MALTPEHGSWLNMAESVLSAPRNQRDDLLGFGGLPDEKPVAIARAHEIALAIVREACVLHRLPTNSTAYWQSRPCVSIRGVTSWGSGAGEGSKPFRPSFLGHRSVRTEALPTLDDGLGAAHDEGAADRVQILGRENNCRQRDPFLGGPNSQNLGASPPET